MKGVYKKDERVKFRSSARCDANTIVDVSTEKVRFRASVLSKDEFFNMTNKQIGITRTHSGTHSNTISLFEILIVEGKAIKGENKFS
jgi:hypothetical protein